MLPALEGDGQLAQLGHAGTEFGTELFLEPFLGHGAGGHRGRRQAGRGTAAAARIAQIHDRRLDEQFTNYTRGDGSPWRLSLRDIYARRAGLEVAYNPNDCIERRWGATPQTPDYATCRRQAPAEQRARMEEYRPWFQEARRPPR